MLPQSNARLTSIRRQMTSSEDYDVPQGALTEKWIGSERVYLQERTERLSQGLDSTVYLRRTVILPGFLSGEVAQGDTLLIEPDGRDQITTVARAVAVRTMPGVPGTIRIEMENQ